MDYGIPLDLDMRGVSGRDSRKELFRESRREAVYSFRKRIERRDETGGRVTESRFYSVTLIRNIALS